MIQDINSRGFIAKNVNGTYQHSEFFQINDDVVGVIRQERFSKKTQIIESFSNNYFYGILIDCEFEFKLKNQNRLEVLSVFSSLYLPPFSLAEYHLDKGCVTWVGFFSKKPILTSIQNLKSSNSYLFEFQMTKHLDPFYLFSEREKQSTFKKLIVQQSDQNPLSARAKSLIDSSFHSKCDIHDLAIKLKTNRSYLSRCFKNTYGISPTAYRHMLRIYEGIRLMNQENKSITNSAFESGFENLNRFEDHFKKRFGKNPKDLLFNNLRGG